MCRPYCAGRAPLTSEIEPMKPYRESAEAGDAVRQKNAVDAILNIGVFVADVEIAARRRILRDARRLQQDLVERRIIPLRHRLDHGAVQRHRHSRRFSRGAIAPGSRLRGRGGAEGTAGGSGLWAARAATCRVWAGARGAATCFVALCPGRANGDRWQSRLSQRCAHGKAAAARARRCLCPVPIGFSRFSKGLMRARNQPTRAYVML